MSAHDRHSSNSCLYDPSRNDHSDHHESDPCPIFSAPTAREVRSARRAAHASARPAVRPSPHTPPTISEIFVAPVIQNISRCPHTGIFLLSTTTEFLLRQKADRITLCPLPEIFLSRLTARILAQILPRQHTVFVFLNQTTIFLLHQTSPGPYRPARIPSRPRHSAGI